MKNFIKSFILSLTLINLVGGNFVQAFEDVENNKIEKKYNATRVSINNFISNNERVKECKFDDFWTEENQKNLSPEEIKILNELKLKIEKGEILTIQEKQTLKNMKNKVIRAKLGEEKYKELEKLIEKRESSTELTLPERQRIYELNKECK